MFISLYFVLGFFTGVYVAQEYNLPNVKETFAKINIFINETYLNNDIKEFEKTMSKDTGKHELFDVEELSEDGSELELELSGEEEQEDVNVKKTR